MSGPEGEEKALRSVALRNANAILLARRRAEEDLVRAKEALESRTHELGRSLSLMRATLESTADGILVTGVDGRVVIFNEKFLQVWGLPREKVEGALHADLARLVLPLFRGDPELASRIEQVYASPSQGSLDTLALADGRVFERFSRPQHMDDKIVGRVWSYRDVTARTQMEETVREEARVLDLLNRTGTRIAASLEISSLMQTVSDAATQMSGAEYGAFFCGFADEAGHSVLRHAVTGASHRFGLEDEPPTEMPNFSEAFEGGAPVRCADVSLLERYVWRPPAHGLPLGGAPLRSYLAVPLRMRSAAIHGGLFLWHSVVGAFSERSQRLVVGIAAQAAIGIDNARLYEEARRVAVEREQLILDERAARAEIARVSRLKDEFLATLSHELRTPLTAVLGWAKVLLRKKADEQTVERGLEAIERNAVAQARLIDDLLDMNRIISGKVRLDVQPTDLANVIEAAVDAVRPSADGKDVRLRIVVDPVAGPVSGDPNRLQQVVWNLLTNAVKFTPKGGNVDVVLQRINSHLELSVSDSGAGIAAEFLPHVFDRFRQADSSSTREQGGLGLGLSIVKQLTELHGGEVRATSAGAGRGATFLVSLPLTPVRPASGQVHPASRSGAGAPMLEVDLQGLRVLVVDDEPDARELIRQVLGECHADVDTAASADEALTCLQALRPDLLVSDIGMPGRDGYQLIRDVRRLSPELGGKTPAIALTAFARSEDRTRAMLAGYQVHVSKPIEPRELIATVASLAGRRMG